MSYFALAEKIHAHTMKWARKYQLQNKKSDLTPEQEKWRAFFKTHHHSCDNGYMIALVAEMTGVDLSFLQKGSVDLKQVKWTPYIAITPVGNHNSHSYEIDEVIMCEKVSGGQFTKKDGSVGNHMSQYVADISIPMVDGIEQYLKSISTKDKVFFNKIVAKFTEEV